MDYFYEVYDDVEGFTWYFKSTKTLEEFVRRRIVEHQANMEEYMADFENFRDNETTFEGVNFVFLGYTVTRVWFDD